MATRQLHAAAQGHEGPQGPLCAPAGQDLSRGRSRHAACSSSLFVLPARPCIRVRGWHGSSNRSTATSQPRTASYRILHTGQSFLYCRAVRRSGNTSAQDAASDRTHGSSQSHKGTPCSFRAMDPLSGRMYHVHARRGLTANQACKFLQLQRLQAFNTHAQALVGSDEEEPPAVLDACVDSHPISVTSSGRPSSTGSRVSCITNKSVQGVPELPPRTGSRAASSAGTSRARYNSQAQSELRLMQELLRRDYAVGYVMLSWLLRFTWVMTPAIAVLLQLPQPAMARATKHQLPALLAWLLRDANTSRITAQACEQQQALLLEQLTPEKLRALQDQMVGPAAAVASYASFAKTYQMLSCAPVTAQQLIEFMRKEEQLAERFPGLGLTANLQNGSSAAAVTALLGSTHANATAAAAAAAALGDTFSTAVATSSSGTADTAAVAGVSDVAPVHVEAVPVLTQGTDPVVTAGLPGVLQQLSSQAGAVLQQLVPGPLQGGAGQQHQKEAAQLSTEVLVAQLQALQQRLPGQQDVAGLLSGYQAWLDGVKCSLLEQHEQAQEYLFSLQAQLAGAASDIQQSESCMASIQQQQDMLEAAKQQALQHYEQAKHTVGAVQQQLSQVASLVPAEGWQPDQAAEGPLASAARTAAEQAQGSVLHSGQVTQASPQQPASSRSATVADQQQGREQLEAAMVSLNEAIEDVAAGAGRTSGELSTLITLLSGQLQRNEQRGPAMADAAVIPGLLDATELARLSAAAVGDVWHADAAPYSVQIPVVAAAAVRGSAAAPTENGAAVSGDEPHLQASSCASSVVKATTTALPQQQHHDKQKQQQQQEDLTPLQKLLLIDAAIVEPQWRKFAAQASGWTHSQLQAVAQAAQDATAAAAQLQAAAQAAAAGPLQDKASATAAQLCEAAGAVATAAQKQIAERASQVQGTATVVARQMQQQAVSAAVGLHKHAAAAAVELSQSDAAAVAAKLHAEATTAASELHGQVAAAAAHAAAVIDEAKSRVDGKAPGEQRTWQEEVLAASGVLSLISPYWWSEETIAGIECAPQAAAKTAGTEPLVQGAYGSDGSGGDDSGGSHGGGGSGRGQGPNSNNENGSDGDNSTGDGSSADAGAGGSSGGGDNGGGGGGGGAGGGGNTGNGSGPWDGFEQFPPPGGFDPVMLLPLGLAAATAGIAALFDGGNSNSSARYRTYTSQGSAQHHSLKQLKNSSSTNKDSSSKHCGQDAASQPRQQRGRAHSVQAAAMLDLQAAAAAGAVMAAAPVALVPQGQREQWLVNTYTPHLHMPGCDQPVLIWTGADVVAAKGGTPLQAGSTAPGGTAVLARDPALCSSSPAGVEPRGLVVPQGVARSALVPFSTSQQVSWEELEELPLTAKQEILSLRAVCAANKQQQRALQRQLQAVEQQLQQKEQDLAASATKMVLLQADYAAALSELQDLKGDGATSQVQEIAAEPGSATACNISSEKLRSTFAAQVSHLVQEAAAANSAAALQIAALQAQLETNQHSAADAVAGLEMRLSKMCASKAKLQLQMEDSNAAHAAQLLKSQRATADLQQQLQEAFAALHECQQQVVAEQAAKEELQQTSETALAAAAVAYEQQAHELSVTSCKLAEVTAELAACAADLLAAQAHSADLEQQLLASKEGLTGLQAASAEERSTAAAHVAELTAEVNALKAGYGPVLLGLEAELAVERTNAHKQVSQLKMRMAETEDSITGQMRQLQQQLLEAEATCSAASARSDRLQKDLEAMQEQQEAVVQELQSVRAASAAHVVQLEADLLNLQADLDTAKAVADEASKQSTDASSSAGNLLEQLDATRTHAEQLQTRLEASLSEAHDHIVSLEQQICGLKQQQLAEATAASEQLEGMCASSTQQVAEVQARLEEERAAAEQQLAALTAELEGVRGGYTAFVSQLEKELSAERSFGRRQVAEVKAQLETAQAQLENLQHRLQGLEAQKTRLESEHAALQESSAAQQQAAAQELASLKDKLAAVQQQEAEALQRCSYLEAELAAATAEEVEEVAALRQVLEQQRNEMALQVNELQTRLVSQEQEALAHINQLQQQLAEYTQQQEQVQQELLQEQQAAEVGFDRYKAQLEAELQETRDRQQQKLVELQGMLSAARQERDQLSAAMQLLSRAVAGSAEWPEAAAGEGAADDAAPAGAAPLAAAVQQLHEDVTQLKATSLASKDEADKLQQQLLDVQKQCEQQQLLLEGQLAQAQADLAALQEQYGTAQALAESLLEQLAAAQHAAASASADQDEVIAQLQQQLTEQEARLQELSVLATAAERAVAVAERRCSESHDRASESEVKASPAVEGITWQPAADAHLVPALQVSLKDSESLGSGAAAVAAGLADVSAQLVCSRQEAASKAAEVEELRRSLEAAQSMLSSLEAQVQDLQGKHSSEVSGLQQAVAAARAQNSELEQRLMHSAAEADKLQQLLQEAERAHAQMATALQQELQAQTGDTAQRVVTLEETAAEALADSITARAAAAKAKADADALAAELAAAQTTHAAALSAVQQEHSSSVEQLQQQVNESAATVTCLEQQLHEAVAAAQAAQHALADSNAHAAELAEALTAAKDELRQQLESVYQQHAADAARSAAQLQGLQQQLEAQEAATAAARAERDQVQQRMLALQAELSAAAAQHQEKEEALRQQLADAQQGLQYNISQMEDAAQTLAAVDAQQQALCQEKAALEAEHEQLLQRCRRAEHQLQQTQQTHIQQLRGLRLAVQQPDALTEGLPAGPNQALIPAEMAAAATATASSTEDGSAMASCTELAHVSGGVVGSRRASSTASVKADLLQQSSELAGLAAEITRLLAASDSRQRQLDDMSAQLTASAATASMWKAQAELAAEEKVEVLTQHEQTHSALQQKAVEVEQLAARVESLLQQLEALQAEKKATEEQLATAQGLIKQSNDEAAWKQEDSHQQLANLQTEVAQLQQQLEAQCTQKEALQQAHDTHKALMQQLQDQLVAKAAELVELQQQMQVQAAQQHALDQQLMAELAVAAEQQSSIQAALQHTQGQLADLQQERAELVAKCASLQAHYSQLTADQAQQDELEEQVQQLEENLQSKQQQLKDLQQEICSKQATEQELRQQAQQWQQQAEMAQQQMHEATQTCSLAQEQLAAAQQEKLQLESERDNCQVLLQTAQAELQDCQQQLQAIQAELSSTKQIAEQQAVALQSLAEDKDAALAAAQQQKSELEMQLGAVSAEMAAVAAKQASAASEAAASVAARQELERQLSQRVSALAAALAECEAQETQCRAAAAATKQSQCELLSAEQAHAIRTTVAESAAAAAAEVQVAQQAEVELSQQLTALQQQYTTLKHQLEVQQAASEEESMAKQQLKEQLAEAQSAAEAAAQVHEQTQQQLAAAQSEHAASQTQLQAEQNAHALATAAIHELEEQVAELKTAADSAAEAHAEAQQQLATLQAQHEAMLQQLQVQQAAAEEAAEAKQGLEQQLAELQDTQAATTQMLTDSQQHLRTLQEQHTAMQQQHAAEMSQASEQQLQLEKQVAELTAAAQQAAAVVAEVQQELETAQEQLEGEQAVHAATAHAKQQLEQQLAELSDTSAVSAQERDELRQELEGKQRRVDSLQAELDDQRNMTADVGLQKQRLEDIVDDLDQQLSDAKDSLNTVQQRLEQQVQELQAQLQDAHNELLAANENQQALAEQLLEAHAEKAKLVMKVSSRGGARGTDESGAWRLLTVEDSPVGSEDMQDALVSAQQQLESLEQDVLALEFVAQHDALDDICDLEMHYNNPHLESIHRTVVELRRIASQHSSPRPHPIQSHNGSEVSTNYTASIAGMSTVGSSRAASKGGAGAAAAAEPEHQAPAVALAELGAKAEAAASRPLVLTSAVDSSLQAVQAAKLSLQSMHDKDMRLELISQSVKDVLERVETTGQRTSESLVRRPTEAGPLASQGGSGAAAAAAGAEADTSIRESLLAAKTMQEVEAIVAKAFDTADDPPLEALLSRSSTSGRSTSAAASAGGASSLGGASTLTMGSGSCVTEKLSAEIECFKQQIATLQQELALKDKALKGAASTSSTPAQQSELKLQGQLTGVQEDTAKAQAAVRELQVQKQAAEEAQQQLLVQINVLQQEAADLKQLQAQLAEVQAAKADLLSRSQATQQELDDARQRLQELQREKTALQQQASRVADLEAEVARLQQQLQQLIAQRQDATEGQLPGSKAAGGSQLSTADSTAAVSAVRAATHNLLLHSNPFELDLGSEPQLMLPTSADDAADMPSKTVECAEVQPLSRPLEGSLLSPNSALQSREMDGMAEMLSSDHQEVNTQPAAAELETECMYYTHPARMTQSLLDGANLQPVQPSSEAEGDTDNTISAAALTQPKSSLSAPGAMPDGSSASCTIMEEPEDSRVGVISDSVPAGIAARAVLRAPSSPRARIVSAPGPYDLESDEAQRLAQRALRTLQSQKASLKERGSWPGDDRAASAAKALASAAQDISRLGVELQEQQVAVRQKLLASQALADSLKRQATAANLSMDEVVAHFFQVYNIACFVAADRERVLEQLIEARAAEHSFASQLASRSNHIQQLVSDRELALEKLCHSEEKLVALEAQLVTLEAQLQEKQELLAAQGATLDVAAMSAGPLAGLTPKQMADLYAMLEQANAIVQQQRNTVQDALLRWRRSSGGGNTSTRASSPGAAEPKDNGTAVDAAIAAAASADSQLQLAQLQHQQQQLMNELGSLSNSSNESFVAQPSNPKAIAASQQLQVEATPEGSAAPQLVPGPLPEDVTAYVNSLAARLMSMQALTEHITAEVLAKHQEALALQANFMKVEVTKQLLSEQLEAKSAEAAALQEQLQALKAELAQNNAAPAANVKTPGSPTGASAEAKHWVLSPRKSSFASRLKLPWGQKQLASGTPASQADSKPASPIGVDAAPEEQHPAAELAVGAANSQSNAPAAAAPGQPQAPASATGSAADSMSGSSPRSSGTVLAHLVPGAADKSPAAATPAPGATDVATAEQCQGSAGATAAGGAGCALQDTQAGNPCHQPPSDARPSDASNPLATATRPNPGVLELVQHFEVVTGMDRSASCSLASAASSNSVCSSVEPSARSVTLEPTKGKQGVIADAPSPTASATPHGWIRPSPLPRVATLTRTSLSSPKGSSAAKTLASPKATAVTPSSSVRSAFGRSVPAPVQVSSPSGTSRIPSIGGGALSSPKSPSLSALASGASTPGKLTTGGSSASTPDMAAVSKQLQAASKASRATAGIASSRIPGTSATLTRTGSSASAQEQAAAASSESSSLNKQVSRLVPGSSNGSTSSERGSAGGSSVAGSIFKQSAAAAKHKTQAVASSASSGKGSGKKASVDAGITKKAK